jgi:hypothetical protein
VFPRLASKEQQRASKDACCSSVFSTGRRQHALSLGLTGTWLNCQPLQQAQTTTPIPVMLNTGQSHLLPPLVSMNAATSSSGGHSAASSTSSGLNPVNVNVRDAGTGRVLQMQAPAPGILPIKSIQDAFGLTNIRLDGNNTILYYDPAGFNNTVDFQDNGEVVVRGDAPLHAEPWQQVEDQLNALQAQLGIAVQKLAAQGVNVAHQGMWGRGWYVLLPASCNCMKG